MKIWNFNCVFFETPKIHKEANILGLPVIKKLGLIIQPDKNHVEINLN